MNIQIILAFVVGVYQSLDLMGKLTEPTKVKLFYTVVVFSSIPILMSILEWAFGHGPKVAPIIRGCLKAVTFDFYDRVEKYLYLHDKGLFCSQKMRDTYYSDESMLTLLDGSGWYWNNYTNLIEVGFNPVIIRRTQGRFCNADETSCESEEEMVVEYDDDGTIFSVGNNKNNKANNSTYKELWDKFMSRTHTYINGNFKTNDFNYSLSCNKFENNNNWLKVYCWYDGSNQKVKVYDRRADFEVVKILLFLMLCKGDTEIIQSSYYSRLRRRRVYHCLTIKEIIGLVEKKEKFWFAHKLVRGSVEGLNQAQLFRLSENFNLIKSIHGVKFHDTFRSYTDLMKLSTEQTFEVVDWVVRGCKGIGKCKAFHLVPNYKGKRVIKDIQTFMDYFGIKAKLFIDNKLLPSKACLQSLEVNNSVQGEATPQTEVQQLEVGHAIVPRLTQTPGTQVYRDTSSKAELKEELITRVKFKGFEEIDSGKPKSTPVEACATVIRSYRDVLTSRSEYSLYSQVASIRKKREEESKYIEGMVASQTRSKKKRINPQVLGKMDEICNKVNPNWSQAKKPLPRPENSASIRIRKTTYRKGVEEMILLRGRIKNNLESRNAAIEIDNRYYLSEMKAKLLSVYSFEQIDFINEQLSEEFAKEAIKVNRKSKRKAVGVLLYSTKGQFQLCKKDMMGIKKHSVMNNGKERRKKKNKSKKMNELNLIKRSKQLPCISIKDFKIQHIDKKTIEDEINSSIGRIMAKVRQPKEIHCGTIDNEFQMKCRELYNKLMVDRVYNKPYNGQRKKRKQLGEESVNDLPPTKKVDCKIECIDGPLKEKHRMDLIRVKYYNFINKKSKRLSKMQEEGEVILSECLSKYLVQVKVRQSELDSLKVKERLKKERDDFNKRHKRINYAELINLYFPDTYFKLKSRIYKGTKNITGEPIPDGVEPIEINYWEEYLRRKRREGVISCQL